MKIYTKLEDCEKQAIVKMFKTKDGKYLGIRTHEGVIFFRGYINTIDGPGVPSYEASMKIIDNWYDVPKELLDNLNLKLDLVATDVPQVFTREK